MVQGHGQHVEKDEEHNGHVELLVGDDAEDDGLGFPLKHDGGKLVTVSFAFIVIFVLTLGLGVALTGFLLPIFFMAA